MKTNGAGWSNVFKYKAVSELIYTSLGSNHTYTLALLTKLIVYVTQGAFSFYDRSAY